MNVGFYHVAAGRMHAGGIAVYVRELAIELAADHEVYLYTGQGDVVAELADSDVTVIQIPNAHYDDRVTRLARTAIPVRDQLVRRGIGFARSLRGGVIAHMEANLDVLLTQGFLNDLLLSHAVDVPTVFQYHGVQSAGIGSTCRERFSRSHHAIANSHHTASAVRDVFGRDVGAVVEPGVDTAQFSPDATPAFEDSADVLLFVGRFIEDKGVDDLLAARSEMSASPALHFVGRDDPERLRRRARELGVAADVTVHESVPHGEIHRYFAAADVFCNPSYFESFGMTNLEAMACGLPVVTTDAGGITEYATDLRNARLVDPGAVDVLAATLDELLASPSKRRRLGRDARATAMEYSWERQADLLVRHCRDFLDATDDRVAAPIRTGR